MEVFETEKEAREYASEKGLKIFAVNPKNIHEWDLYTIDGSEYRESIKINNIYEKG